MAIYNLTLQSKYLMGPANVSVLTPDAPGRCDPKEFYSSGKKYKVFWILHGATWDGLSMIRSTAVKRIVRGRDVIVVAPTALNSDYVNHPEFAGGYNFADYFLKELMPFVHNWLPASSDPKDNYLGGFSMGGSGTVTIGFDHPELFGGLAPMGCSLCRVDFLEPYRDMTSYEFRKLAMADRRRFPTEFGNPAEGITVKEINKICKFDTVADFLDSCENTWERYKKVYDKLPPIYCTCGTDDGCYPNTLEFKRLSEDLCAGNVKFEFIPGKGHTMDCWDIGFERALDYFGI